MREHHGVDEAEALRDRHGEEKGDRREDAAPEQDGRGRRDGKIEGLVEPKREERLNKEAAAERVDAEQRREAVDDAPRLPQGSGRRFRRRLDRGRQRPVKQERQEAEHPVKRKHPLHGVKMRQAPSLRRDDRGLMRRRRRCRRRASRSGCSARKARCAASARSPGPASSARAGERGSHRRSSD